MASTDADDPILRRLEALEKATEKRLDDARDIHRREHDAAALAHLSLHQELDNNVKQRFEAHADLHATHAEAHDREHEMTEAAISKAATTHAETHTETTRSAGQFMAMYEQRWATEKEARDLARQAVDKRLEQMNEFRSQLQSQAATFVTVAAHEATTRGITNRLEEQSKTIAQRFTDVSKHTDDRYEDNRKRIEALEKGDVKQEGRSIGQGAVIAAIVAAVGFAATILGLIIVVANLLTAKVPA